ncbi:MAG: DUF5333 domain-containing protein [Silicimonas sp.]|nr:DUF5333 domain-containing protein [Silicimonas sp.]
MLKTIAALILIGTGSSAEALPPLQKNPTVVSGFYAIGLADELRKNCNTIEPRLFRAYRYLKSLERYARNAGYSESQIDELVDNKTEKARLRQEIQADLAKRGATPKSPQAYCTVGLEEIAKGSAAGRLLRAR